MIYTSARYANPEHTQVTGTDANGNTETVALDHKLFRQPDDGPQGFLKAGGKIGAYVAPEAPNLPARIAKNAIWERATDAEAEAMEMMLKQQHVRVRRIYEGATHISTDHELFTLLSGAMTQAFGADRAAELLAPTN